MRYHISYTRCIKPINNLNKGAVIICFSPLHCVLTGIFTLEKNTIKTERLSKPTYIDLYFKHQHLVYLNITARDYTNVTKIITISNAI